MVWCKKAETEDLVKDLDEFFPKFDDVTAIIFMLIDVEGEPESKQEQQCYFSYDHILDSG